MALVTLINQKDKIDGAMKAKIYSFFEKLQKDDTAPGLHIEPMQSPLDPRVRTARIDLNFRAVLFKLSLDSIPHYFYYGAWPHDKAIAIARTTRIQMNPVQGVMEVIRDTTPPPVASAGTVGADSGKYKPYVEPAELEDEPVAETAVPEKSVVPEAWRNPLLSCGISAESLISDLGLESSIVTAAFSSMSDDELLASIEYAPEWQATALLELAAGTTIDDVREKLALTDYVDDPEASEDEKLKKALEHPATRMQFTFVGDNPEELKQVIEGGDFDAWRTFLHPEQRKYAERRFNGPFRLTGGAGTGKTVVLLHRAKMLATDNPDSRTVLTTYNKTLAESLVVGISKLDGHLPLAPKLGSSGLYVGGVDSLVSQVVRTASDSEQRAAMRKVFGYETAIPGKVLGSDGTQNQWDIAVANVDQTLDSELANSTFLQQEYETVVLPNLIVSKDEYLTVPRTGRGTALNRAKRLAVWKIVEQYRYFNRVEMNASYVEIAHLAAQVLRARKEAGQVSLADHLLIDEAQDLHAGHWLFLRELVAVGPDDMFIAEDSHQRIYGQKITLSRFGIGVVGRSKRLTLNYRTTQQNLAYAVGLLRGVHITDIEGEEETDHGYTSSRVGPHPVEASATSTSEELDNLAGYLRDWDAEGVALGTVGILVHANYQISRVINGLKERGLEGRNVSQALKDDIPVVMTMHRSKGMEFTRVVLFGMSESNLAAGAKAGNLAQAELDDAILKERSLLYVAATRARDGLVVSWSGPPSKLLGTK